MYGRLFSTLTLSLLMVIAAFLQTQPGSADPATADTTRVDPALLFDRGDACMGCHNGLVTPAGEDISIGSDWRASMMANSARDPYWQAAVRREVTDHPQAQAEIEDECSTCHMPMSSYAEKAGGGHAAIFAHLPAGAAATPTARLAADGVSCTVCHQIQPDNFGTEASFVGGFLIDRTATDGERAIFGPYAVDDGRTTIMHSATGFRPKQADHLQESELCATCHTLYTDALGPDGKVVGELPEQVPYLEWKHSAFREERSCQSCHMPVVQQETEIASVLGQKRANVSRHVFKGGNFFMLRMLNRYRADLGVRALPQELAASAVRTVENLQSNTARLDLSNLSVTDGQLHARVQIENLAGHKLPTAYPSRRAWIHFSVHDANGDLIFESGALRPDGSIVGNDNDDDPSAFEPHYAEITRPDQVQIYEPILVDGEGAVTTGLLSAVRYAKDNRILPRGFVKETADEDIAVQGRAAEDDDFQGGADQIRYRVPLSDGPGPYRVTVELRYQPIGFRWAHNLAPYDAMETQRFVSYYESMSQESSVALATQVALTSE